MLLFPFFAFLAYWPCVNGPFLFDDRDAILHNPEVVQGKIKPLLKTPFGRGLTLASYAVQSLWPKTSRSFHIVNILLHAVNGGICQRILLTLGFDLVTADRGAILYVVLPFAANTVSYITGRASMLSATFGLLGIWAILAGYPGLSLIALLWAIYAKEDGMGYVFTARGDSGTLLRGALRFALRMLLNPPASKVVFENEEDLAASVAVGSARAGDAVLIRGAGVDTEAFAPAVPPPAPVVVVLGARMLRDKGVQEFVDAAVLLRERGLSVRCVLVGAPDPSNPSSLSQAQLERWRDEGAVEWWGHREDMAQVLRQCHVACLPSYREGLPKFLLEAMACGLPVVATDVIGCRQAVQQSVTGLLVPPLSVEPLAKALAQLAGDPVLRRRFGDAGRERAIRLFDRVLVVRETLSLYAALLGRSATQ